MFTKKITAFALAGLLAVGGTGVTAFAADTDTENTLNVKTGMTLEEFRASGMTAEGLKGVKERLDEKGITLEEAKSNFSGKLEEFAAKHGITVEEAQAQLAEFKESGKSVDGLQNIKAELDAKGITLEEAKINFEGMLNDFAAAKGLTIDEAKDTISQIKGNGKTLEGIKNFQGILSNLPVN